MGNTPSRTPIMNAWRSQPVESDESSVSNESAHSGHNAAATTISHVPAGHQTEARPSAGNQPPEGSNDDLPDYESSPTSSADSAESNKENDLTSAITELLAKGGNGTLPSIPVYGHTVLAEYMRDHPQTPRLMRTPWSPEADRYPDESVFLDGPLYEEPRSYRSGRRSTSRSIESESRSTRGVRWDDRDIQSPRNQRCCDPVQSRHNGRNDGNGERSTSRSIQSGSESRSPPSVRCCDPLQSRHNGRNDGNGERSMSRSIRSESRSVGLGVTGIPTSSLSQSHHSGRRSNGSGRKSTSRSINSESRSPDIGVIGIPSSSLSQSHHSGRSNGSGRRSTSRSTKSKSRSPDIEVLYSIPHSPTAPAGDRHFKKSAEPSSPSPARGPSPRVTRSHTQVAVVVERQQAPGRGRGRGRGRARGNGRARGRGAIQRPRQGPSTRGRRGGRATAHLGPRNLRAIIIDDDDDAADASAPVHHTRSVTRRAKASPVRSRNEDVLMELPMTGSRTTAISQETAQRHRLGRWSESPTSASGSG